MLKLHRFTLLFVLFTFAQTSWAQADVVEIPVAETSSDAEQDDDQEWDVAEPPLETRKIPLEVSEGTWMSLDVSPDGQTIAFDLLGDIYTLPIDGGVATNISSGLPWEIQPRYSADGKHIAFISDREGGDNIWVMDANGENRRSVSEEKFRLLNNPTWSADGNYIAARKHFTTSRSAGTGEIWLYHVKGGAGIALVERSSETFQKELGEPIFSADGRYIYYSKNITPGDRFIYAQDSNTDLFNILRYDMQTGKNETVVAGAGGAVRATPSPDGNSIAFIRRERTLSKLFVKDLATGEETKLVDELDQDMQETWGVTGMYPNMDWTPDGNSIVYWAGGKIRQVNVANGSVKEIPFEVNDEREIIDPPRPVVEVAPATFSTQMPRFASVSPDGQRVVFETLGKLWLKTSPDAKPRRLTRNTDNARELFPSWSRDGRSIVFASWSDELLGSIRTVSATGGSPRTVTSQPGHYRRPQFSPSGDSIAFEKGSGGFLTSGEWSEQAGIYVIPRRGGQARKVTESGSYPHFAQDEDRVFLTQGGDGVKLISVNLDGLDERVHATSELVAEYQVSPDGDHLAFHENYDVHIMPMLPGPQAIATGRSGTALPQVEVSGDGSTYMHWSNDGAQINWTLGADLFSAQINELFPTPLAKSASEADAEKSGEDTSFEPPEASWNLSMEFDADIPSGTLLLTNARIVSMADNQGGVIENGSILIENNRIKAVGASLDVPVGAKTVDLEGKTITPGFIDAHAHGPQGVDDIIPQQNWSTIAHLALGVTTIFDPSSRASMIFPAAEYQRAGKQLAPRTYSTGEVVYGAKAPGFYASIESYDDAKEHVNRLANQGAHAIKNYNQPRRDQRQQVVAASLEADIAVVAEGGSNFHMDMAMVADGNTSIEHNLPQAMIYEDVLSMYSQTDVAYVPTLTVTYGGLAGDPYWRQATDVWTHPILSKHAPPRRLQAGSVRRTTAPEADFVDDVSAKTAKLLFDRGVPVAIGAHGQQQGLAAHWEIWSFARGGFSPIEALRTATSEPAKHLGFDKDLGSIEVGKLADLVIMNSNPLDDIRNTDDIHMVMLNGRLYEPQTMNEVHTGNQQREPYFWE